jgi:hypothetical protein
MYDLRDSAEPSTEARRALAEKGRAHASAGDTADLGACRLVFGKHKGKTIAEVDTLPGGRAYLRWLANEARDKFASRHLKHTAQFVRRYLKERG